jgi:hypothetical protein
VATKPPGVAGKGLHLARSAVLIALAHQEERQHICPIRRSDFSTLFRTIEHVRYGSFPSIAALTADASSAGRNGLRKNGAEPIAASSAAESA